VATDSAADRRESPSAQVSRAISHGADVDAN
jgi:hypothetical protein